MKGKYLYGIIKKSKNTGITTVDFRRLSAVVAKAEYKDYHSLPKEEAIKELTRHQQTIEKIMENFGAVLPVKFGTILKDEKEVKSVLEKGYSFLQDILGKMEDKIELDLVCFWNEQKAAQMAFKESKKIRDFYKKIAKTPRMVASPKPPAKAGLLRGEGGIESKIALGKLVAQYLASKKKKISSQILELLKKEAVESCSHTLADINMIVNQALLVEKENEEVFNHNLNRLNSRFKELVNFRLVGPLPPYSFATVVVESLDEEEVDAAKKLLKLDSELSREKIKHAFNKLAKRFHPDKGGDPLAFEFVTKGYKLLRKYVEHGLVGVCLYKWEDQGEP